MPTDETAGRPGLVKIFSSMMRQVLMFEYAEQEASPSKVAEKLGVPLNVVAYHTNVLLAFGFIELVGTRRVRGAVEHTYRAVDGPPISDDEWADLRPKVRRALSRLLVDEMSRDAYWALDEGAMDRATTHLSRSRLFLDDQGREELSALLNSTLEAAGRIEADARARMGQLDPVGLHLLAFDDPHG
jgi:hypothetical protein